MGEMGGEMGEHGGRQQQLYPSLMTAPPADPAAREVALREAHRRMTSGLPLIRGGLDQATRALQSGDAQGMGEAAGRLSEGLSLYRSGLSTHLALSAGHTPAQAGLAWYRSQLGLPPATAMPMATEAGGALWGLSWFHLTTMVFLAAFVVGTLLIQYTRMRRISGLVHRLATAATAVATGPAAAPAGGPPGPRPAAPSPPGAAGLLPVPRAAAAPPPVTAPAPAICCADPLCEAAVAAAKRPWSGILRVAAIFPETPTVKTFRLVNPGSGDIPFVFMPGQFLTFSAEIGGERARRSYTIASSPTQRSYIEVTVKREEQGLISRHLHDRVAIGSLLEVSAPAGVFTFTGADADSIVLIAGGVGVTPMMSITRYLMDRSFPGDIYFLYGARSTEEFIFREELEYLQKRHANLHIAATMSRAEGTAWMGASGPISKEFIARAVPEIARRRVHLCGPPPMMEAVKAALSELGVPKDQVRTEAFGPARGVTPGTRAPLPAPSLAPAPAPAAPEPAPAVVPRIATAEVRFTKSSKTGPLAPDQCVLEAAEAIGVPIDYSCRVGICGTCKVRLLEGKVTMEVEEGLPSDEKARGIILACQAKSVGNLVVEA
ncbi:MAG: 2Fe-2S iron-sulfur cluster binding domain-containing protein [Rhodospirillales bacterium]|nr:2Fe-2S iron-sulfur cluster binding domain-containing protein [Rhodospirillales bacterium]